MGETYGLAKKATAIAVKVLTDTGGGTSAYVLNCGSPTQGFMLIIINSAHIHTVAS